jgi:hypothetical protein
MHHRTLGAASLALGLLAGGAQAATFHVNKTNSPYTSRLTYSASAARGAFIEFMKDWGAADNAPAKDFVTTSYCQPRFSSHSIRNLATGKVVAFGYYRPAIGAVATGCKVSPAP